MSKWVMSLWMNEDEKTDSSYSKVDDNSFLLYLDKYDFFPVLVTIDKYNKLSCSFTPSKKYNDKEIKEEAIRIIKLELEGIKNADL